MMKVFAFKQGTLRPRRRWTEPETLPPEQRALAVAERL